MLLSPVLLPWGRKGHNYLCWQIGREWENSIAICACPPQPGSWGSIATISNLWFQQVLWPHLSQQGSVGGNGYCIWVCSPVLAGHVESATIVSTGASASREHCSGPLALWLMPQISSLGTFQTTIFSVGLRLGESTCKPSRRGVPVFYGTLGPPDISHWHSKPDILGACLSGVDLRGWGTWCWVSTPCFSGSWDPFFLCHWTGTGSFCETVSLPLLPISVCSFYPLL